MVAELVLLTRALFGLRSPRHCVAYRVCVCVCVFHPNPNRTNERPIPATRLLLHAARTLCPDAYMNDMAGPKYSTCTSLFAIISFADRLATCAVPTLSANARADWRAAGRVINDTNV